MPKGGWDVAIGVQGEKSVDAFPCFGDVVGVTEEVVEAVVGGGRAGFDGEEGIVVVEVFEDGKGVRVVMFVSPCDAMGEDTWIDVHDGDCGDVLVEIILCFD